MGTAALTVFQENFLDVSFSVSMADFHSLSLQASFSYGVSVMLNALSRFNTSRKRSFGRPVGREALGSSLYRTCFGRRLSSIRHTWPAIVDVDIWWWLCGHRNQSLAVLRYWAHSPSRTAHDRAKTTQVESVKTVFLLPVRCASFTTIEKHTDNTGLAPGF